MKEWIKTGEETKYNKGKNGLKQERRQNTIKKEWIKTGEETKYNKERMD